jgi:hypothetical protein
LPFSIVGEKDDDHVDDPIRQAVRSNMVYGEQSRSEEDIWTKRRGEEGRMSIPTFGDASMTSSRVAMQL